MRLRASFLVATLLAVACHEPPNGSTNTSTTATSAAPAASTAPVAASHTPAHSAPAASSSSPAEPAAVDSDEYPAGTTRLYQGTLGANTHIEMLLEGDHAHVYGAYKYSSAPGLVRLGITLAGKVDAKGALELKEGKTGAFTLTRDGHGGLSGTWADAKGVKSYPVALSPWGVRAASRQTYLDFLARYARLKKKPALSASQLAAISGTEQFSLPTDPDALAPVIPYELPELATLYVADVNNDGVPDYVVVWTNQVSNHNESIWGVYDDAIDAGHPSLRPLDLTAALGKLELATYRDDPFLEVTPRGTVVRMMNLLSLDKRGDVINPVVGEPDRSVEEHDVYLWKGSRVERLDHTRKVTPVKR